MSRFVKQFFTVLFLASLASTGCKTSRQAKRECPTPATLGMHTRDMVDKAQQDELDSLVNIGDFAARRSGSKGRVRKGDEGTQPERSALPAKEHPQPLRWRIVWGIFRGCHLRVDGQGGSPRV